MNPRLEVITPDRYLSIQYLRLWASLTRVPLSPSQPLVGRDNKASQGFRGAFRGAFARELPDEALVSGLEATRALLDAMRQVE